MPDEKTDAPKAGETAPKATDDTATVVAKKLRLNEGQLATLRTGESVDGYHPDEVRERVLRSFDLEDDGRKLGVQIAEKSGLDDKQIAWLDRR